MAQPSMALRVLTLETASPGPAIYLLGGLRQVTFTSLGLNFHIWKMGIILELTSQG